MSPWTAPRDVTLAKRVVERQATTQATDDEGLQVDLTLVMTGFRFEEVWRARTTFVLVDVEVPVARLEHIVRSKARRGQGQGSSVPGDHEAALRELLGPGTARES